MKINEFVTEAPATDKSNDNMRRGRFSDLAKQKRTDALKAKQAATNAAKSKISGDVGEFGAQRAQAKAMQNKVVKHPGGLTYQYVQTKKGWQWQEVDPKVKDPETGLNKVIPGTYPLNNKDAVSMELTDIAKGVKPTKGMLQKAKDAAMDKIGGPLATKTMTDPDATTTQKAGATVGAALGRATANLLRRKPTEPQQLKQPTAMATVDLKAFQGKMLDPDRSDDDKMQAAQDLLNTITAQQAKGVDVDKYVQSIAPIMKHSGLNKTNPQFYSKFATDARKLRTEAFEYMDKVLEAAGITWAQLGYTVVIAESKADHVLLLDNKTLNEAIQLENIKALAGI